ncbi:MAG: rod-binding protein [Devosia sp.]|jgi:Rod binding domain-containing protein
MQTLAPLPKIDTTSPAYARLHQQARDLEGVFLTSLMKEMFSSIKTDDQNFGGGFAEETWRGMQAEQFAGAMAEQGGIGLADQLMPTLLRMQEAAPAS